MWTYKLCITGLTDFLSAGERVGARRLIDWADACISDEKRQSNDPLQLPSGTSAIAMPAAYPAPRSKPKPCLPQQPSPPNEQNPAKMTGFWGFLILSRGCELVLGRLCRLSGFFCGVFFVVICGQCGWRRDGCNGEIAVDRWLCTRWQSHIGNRHDVVYLQF